MKDKISFEIPDMDERGVSPVIGVILMVAITVILAAVIASFVLGFGNSVSTNANAGTNVDFDAEPAAGSASVTWISGGNADHVNVSVTANGYEKYVDLQQVSDKLVITENDNATDTAADGSTIIAPDEITFAPVSDSGDSTALGNPSDTDTKVSIVVTAVKGETRTVVNEKTVTI